MEGNRKIANIAVAVDGKGKFESVYLVKTDEGDRLELPKISIDDPERTVHRLTTLLGETPGPHTLFTRDFHEMYKSRDQETRVHTYMTVSLGDYIEEGDGEWVEMPKTLVDEEVETLGKALDYINSRSFSIFSLLQRVYTQDELITEPTERDFTTVCELRQEKPFGVGFTPKFEKPEKPWNRTDDGFPPKLVQPVVEGAIVEKQIPPIGGHIYCNNPGCNRGTMKTVGSDTLLRMKKKAPQLLSKKQSKQLRESTSDFKCTINPVENGDIVYGLIAPSESEKQIEFGGWYCSPQCVSSVPWPESKYFAVAVELYIPTSSATAWDQTLPKVRRLMGVFRRNPPKLNLP